MKHHLALRHTLHQFVLYGVIVFSLVACNGTGTAVPPTSSLTTQPLSHTPTSTPRVLVTDVREIVGIWRGSGVDAMYLEFRGDGTYKQSFTLDDLKANPNVIGPYEFKGSRIVFGVTSVRGVPTCDYVSGSYEILPLEYENEKLVRIKLVPIVDPCSPRARTTAVEHARMP